MSAPADAPTTDAPAPASAPRSVPLALILAVVAGLAAGVGGGFFAVGPALAKGIAPAVAANAKHGKAAKPAKGAHDDEAAEGDDEEGHGEAAGDEEDEEEGEGEEAKGGHGKEGAAAGAPVYTLDNLVLNPAQSGGTRFLLLTISFEVKQPDLVEAMKARDAELRDLVLVTVGNKTVEQLSDVASRDSLKVELKAAAAKLFKKKAIKRVYFPQFVIQ
jgi:flagellar FliL protein